MPSAAYKDCCHPADHTRIHPDCCSTETSALTRAMKISVHRVTVAIPFFWLNYRSVTGATVSLEILRLCVAHMEM